MSPKLPTILDNRESQTALAALKQLLPEAKNLDVATGYFEIGSFLALESFWNDLEKIRIIMGDETTRRTKKELVNVIRQMSEESIEREKERDDNLRGLAAVKEAFLQGKIEAKVYTKAKFHAKAYLMGMKTPHLSNYGIVGSSNFTEPGLCKNIELNLLSTEQHQLQALQQWYEERWRESETLKEEVLQAIEPHLKLYSPFEVYIKALHEFYFGKEIPTSSWEETESVIYPILDDLQRTGYRQALWIAEQWGGTLICDGVGFGKTYIGLMLIERFLHERKRIAIIVPKSAKESVWKNRLHQYLNYDSNEAFGGAQIELVCHTDLHREKMKPLLESVKRKADVILIDEAHHFRTRFSQRGEQLFDMIECDGKKKKVFLLTATPVNNSLFDLLHLMEYFTRDDRAYFRKLGINDTRRYFVQKEKAVEIKMGLNAQAEDQESLYPDFDIAEAEKILREDSLFRTLVIQRSRDYAKRYFRETGNDQFYFPERETPKVQPYKLANIYGQLFRKIKESFNRKEPFLDLALYNVEAYRRNESAIDPKIANRERQVLMLIRATMLKRMESSYKAFEASCEDLLRKMARFLRYYDSTKWEKWKKNLSPLWEIIETHWRERYLDDEEVVDVEEDDILPEPKEKLLVEDFFMDQIVASVSSDMDELAGFLSFIHENITEKRDDKLKSLIDLLESDRELRTKKVIIFTQYRDTARYLYRQLKDAIKGPMEELDSTCKKDREVIIKRFAPYYNCTEEELPEYLEKPIRVLISTDVLSEGLNLQDAHLLINYDLHWNPVRLMQRIGRVDRRLDPAIEKKLEREHCVVRFWNFLPPDELDDLLQLYQRVAGKILRISKTLGIEGKKLLGREEDLDALRDFNASYNGVMTFEEKMRIIYTGILKKYPELLQKLPKLPKRLFSGKTTRDENIKGVFAAYRLPERKVAVEVGASKVVAGEVRWFFHKFGTDEVLEDIEAIHALIASNETTPRVVHDSIDELRTSLKLIEQKCVQRELRNMQAAVGEKATLICWMEVS
ncbi:MAG: helicase-related protein [Bacteroidota bacterium]|jgi:superfamily II DNA or RNA helicase